MLQHIKNESINSLMRTKRRIGELREQLENAQNATDNDCDKYLRSIDFIEEDLDFVRKSINKQKYIYNMIK